MFLSKIQSLRLSAVLENCSDQLDVLSLTLTVPPSKDQGPGAAQERDRMIKLKRDCYCAQQLISDLHEELEQTQTFTSLVLQEELEEKRRRERKENQSRSNVTNQRQAEKELQQRKQCLQRRREELKEKTKKLKDLDDVLRLKSVEVDYTTVMEKYMDLQTQESQKDNSRVDNQLQEQLKALQQQLEEESRVHEESEKFLQKQHEQLQQELQRWQHRTKLMMQEKEEQLNSVRRRKTVNLDKLSEMKRRCREMEEVVMEDREEQVKLRQKQAELFAAIKLQAWWRGCMVRKGLVTVTKEEKTKKSKKSKEGKKKTKKKK